MKDIITKIKSKKYSSISDDLIEQEIDNFLKQKPRAKDKEIVKEVKARLHRIYGSFQIKKKKKRESLLEDLKKKTGSTEIHEKILETNLSTKERLRSYRSLYQRIFKITGTPHSILDIGSGINPISYPFMKAKPEYTAVEIDEEEVDFLNEYFKIKNIKGKAIVMNINEENLKSLPKVDVCLLFKVVDPLERKNHKFSEILIKAIKAKFLVVSFSTKTVSGRAMKYPRRGWFEQMMVRLGYHYNLLKTQNEFYYVVEK
jgi:hypothetical protein